MSETKDLHSPTKITTISIDNDSTLDTIHEGVEAEITPTPLRTVTIEDSGDRGRTASFHLPAISEQGPFKMNEEELQKQYTRRTSAISTRSYKPGTSRRPSVAPSIAFQHYDPKYKCMCESLHVAQGAIKPDNDAGNLLTSLTLENFSEFFSDDDYNKKEEMIHSLSVIRMIAIFIAITTFFLIIIEAWFARTLYKAYVYFKDIITSEIRKAARMTGGRRMSNLKGPRESALGGKRTSVTPYESGRKKASIARKESNSRRVGSPTAKPEFQAQKF
uniref:Uncharacterized protein n=1 Tax=Parastrongyloides trichosuri TaxID=131310 RepID=A0A0N4ZJ67_PARTI